MNSSEKCFTAVSKILENLPESWVELTTHRLDIYNEALAKSEFLQQLTDLSLSGNFNASQLEALPTAYDYIRLGHQLSSILEWLLGEVNQVPAEQVITFTSKTMPILAVLRKNTLNKEQTHIYYTGEVPLLDVPRLTDVYGYTMSMTKVNGAADIPKHSEGVVVMVTQSAFKQPVVVNSNIDVTVNIHSSYGSAMVIHNANIVDIVKDIQHVRRRETIAITPVNALKVLRELVSDRNKTVESYQPETCPPEIEAVVFKCIQQNTGSNLTPLIASSGLSIQYAIMMGLVENAMTQHPHKPINIILPPNCYGGTNDQARRIADLISNVSIVDLLVDGGQNLVTSLGVALAQVAENDSIPLVLAEIPTNPRVEVPDMNELGKVLSVIRKTQGGEIAVEPIIMVDQTFCPNVKLLHQESELVAVKTISFSSGSKFPSGGRCIAGYCAANKVAKDIIPIIEKHLILSDNSAVTHQLITLAENMPSMPERIVKAYENTRLFVNYVQQTLPQAKINFVSEDLAKRGFTPSVFSLDLPSKGNSEAEKEEYKRVLNEKLIAHMVKHYPDNCKHCVSYGQLKGSYWTIPATSTQGTTKENDKDYIVRVALSPDIDIKKLSSIFSDFCRQENLQ